MYNIHTEMPSGAVSRGYEYETEETAVESYTRVKSQLTDMGFVGTLIMTEGGIELQREAIPNAVG